MKTVTTVYRVLVMCVLAALACGSNSNPSESPEVGEFHVRGGRGDEVALDLSPPATTESVSNALAISVASDGGGRGSGGNPLRPRMVIKTAELQCEVADYDSVLAEIQRLTERAGGYIVSSTVQHRDADARGGSLILRIPSNAFEPTLRALKTLATTVDRESIQGNDVTEEFYDLSARLDNKRKAEKRFQEILHAAKKSSEILEVEHALTNIREEIERMEGRKRYLTDQSDLSTIMVAMHEPAPMIAAGTTKFGARFKNALGSGLELGLGGFVNVVSGLIAVMITAIPFVLVAITLFWVGRKYYRRSHPAAAAAESQEKSS